MHKVCKTCGNGFEITEDDLRFYEKVSPVFDDKKYLIPPPTLCPDCRQQLRLVQRNENKLYKRKCDFTGENMISLYSEEKPFKVYKEEIWWSDKWDSLSYGRNFDPDKPFFKQLQELQSVVPRRGMHQDGTNENCEYITFGMSNKNSYLAFACFYCDNIYFSRVCGMTKDSLDCYLCFECELCYECLDCKKCYQCIYCQDCLSCDDCYFVQDCRNCHHCIGCKNLRNKEYYIYNKPVKKEEFEAYKKKLIEGEILKEKANFMKWKLHLPFIYAHISQSENSDGDYLEQAKNCHDCFDVLLGAQDSRYCQLAGWGGKDMNDCMMTGKDSELLYQMTATTGTYHSAFNNFCRWGHNVYYCEMISNCKNCFGCIGLGYKEFCILNKQYSKKEYEELVPQIIEKMIRDKEWGEFFPASFTPFAYNETLANEYFPLTKEEALKKGFKWKENNVSDTIKSVSSSVINETLSCETCGKNYKIISQELELYKKIGIPLPKKCHECRYIERLSLRNPRKLWDRKCAKCGTAIKTTYSPDRPEIVYCEACYLKEVY
ncbi:hypothetical protein JW911_03755 [Candidatus Peregrinibacteria bacterium]|nr:hypothetical protein [Candidatus Peregrinibacteria bacterium]